MFIENFKFNQNDYLKTLPQERRKGVCATLSAAWLRMMREEKGQGDDWRKQQLEQMIIGKRGGAVVTQKAFRDAWDCDWAVADNVKANCKYLIKTVGNADIEESVEYTGQPGVELVKYIYSMHRQGIFFAFCYPTGAHATAYWRSGTDSILSTSHVYWFDPNFGEYKIGKDFGLLSTDVAVLDGDGLNQYLRRVYGVVTFSCALLLKPSQKEKPTAVQGMHDGRRVM